MSVPSLPGIDAGTAEQHLSAAGAVAVLIPAYKPELTLIGLVDQLHSAGFHAICVVDDGSGPEYRDIFDRLQQIAGVTVARHATNLGKGAALKTGLNLLLCDRENFTGIVTVDADGQHLPADVIRCCRSFQQAPQKLVLGARGFRGRVPLRSRFGNSVTKHVVKAVLGTNLTDTQTGLRVIPRDFAVRLLKLRSSGYDFELDMLVTAQQQNVAVQELPIATVYEDGNKSSHFNPLIDSMRIYFVFLRFCSVSLVCAVLDNLLFMAAYSHLHKIGNAQLIARTVSVLFAYVAARRAVFQSHKRHAWTGPRFFGFAVVSGLASYGCIRLLVKTAAVPVFWAKILVETVLFFVSFAVQRDLIFTEDPGTEDDVEAPWPNPVSARERWSVSAVILWAAFAVLIATYAYGFAHTDVNHTNIWTREGWHRFNEYAAWFAGAGLLFTAFGRRWFLPICALAAVGGSIYAIGAWPVIWLLGFALGCIVLTRRLFGRDLSWAVAFLGGLAITCSCMTITARLPIHYRATYVAVLLIVCALCRAEAKDALSRVWRALSRPKPVSLTAHCATVAVCFAAGAHWIMAVEPEVGFDALTMHLTVASNIATHHYFSLDFRDVIWALMPMGGDLCYGLLYVGAGEFAAKLLDLFVLFTTATLIFELARRFLNTGPSLLLSALFLSTPIAEAVTSSLMVENFSAALTIGALAATVAYWREKTGRLLALSAILLGAAAACKIGALAVALIIFLFLIAAVVRIAKQYGRHSSALYATALILFVVPASWPYASAYHYSGSPVFPFSSRFFRSKYIDEPVVDARFSQPLSLKTAYNLTFETSKYYEGQNKSFGFQYMLFFLLSLLALPLINSWSARLAALVGISGALLILSTVPNARYLYPVFPLLTVGFAAALRAVKLNTRVLFYAVVTLEGCFFLLNMACFPASDWSHKDFFPPPLLSEAGRMRMTHQYAPAREAVAYLNRTDRASGVLVTGSPYVAELAGPFQTNEWHSLKFLKKLHGAHTATDVQTVLAQSGIRHILAEEPLQASNLGVPLLTFIQECGRDEFDVKNYASFRIEQNCTAASASR